MDRVIVKDGIIVGYDGDFEATKMLVIPAEATGMSDGFKDILFKKMNMLEKVTVENGNSVWSSLNGILYDRGKSALIYYPRAKRRRTYRMPGTVRQIGPMAFSDFKHSAPMLEEVTLSPALAEIPDNCFRNAGVYTVNIPEGITRIGRYAFAGSNIVCPTLPASLRHLSPSAFHNCKRMHLLNVREDNFGLTHAMLPETQDIRVIFETSDELDRAVYPGIDIMNLLEFEQWLND